MARGRNNTNDASAVFVLPLHVLLHERGLPGRREVSLRRQRSREGRGEGVCELVELVGGVCVSNDDSRLLGDVPDLLRGRLEETKVEVKVMFPM